MNAKIKVILVLILLAPLVYLFSSSTFSYFSDVETSTGNTFTAGTWYVPTQADDLDVDTSSSFISARKLHNVNVSNVGESNITLIKLEIAWTPDKGEEVTKVWAIGQTPAKLWEGNASSGSTLDIEDCTLEPSGANRFEFLFDSNMENESKEFTIEFIMGDGSSKAVTFAPKSC